MSDVKATIARDMPPIAMVKANGITMGVYEVPGHGMPVVLCHGFPELAYSWRHQLAAFDRAGRKAIAPDQRGYGATDAPAAITDYDIAHLTGDLAGLLDARGIDRAIFCGHDWGGIVVWQMALHRPERVAGIIGINTPFMPRPPVEPITILRARMGEDMYIVWFQKPDEADAFFAANVDKVFRYFLRRPTMSHEQFLALPEDQRRFTMRAMIDGYDPTADDGEQIMPDDERRVFEETFRRTGFTGGINWYRNFTRNWELSAGVADKVEVPALMIMAENDHVLPPSMTEGMEHYVPDLERHLIAGSGHWTQQERPDAVSDAILDWLDRRFPLEDNS